MIKSFIGKSKTLTKRKKESTMRNDGVMSFLGVRDLSRRFKKIFSRSLRSLLIFVSRLPLKGRKVFVMKNMIVRSFGGNSSRARSARTGLGLIAGIALVLGLAACGGGGGDSAPAPAVPVTKVVTCPNGSPQSATAATADAAISQATALCALPKVVSVTPANGATGVNLDGTSTFNVAVATDSMLMATASGDVTLKAGQTQVPGTVVAVGDKGVKFTPSAKLLYGQTYAFVANLKDALGRALAVNSTFTTASVACVSPKIPSSDGQSCVNPTCTAPAVWSGTSCEVPPANCPSPAMANSLGTCVSPPAVGSTWNTVMKAWVYPVGMLVVGVNTLPAECATIGDACWTAKIADGTIKLVNTNAVQTGYNTRPIVFAVYKTFDGFFNEMPLYADVAALGTGAGQGVSNGGTASNLSDVKGSDSGIKMTFSAFGCYERVHTGAGSWGNVKLTSCPI